MQRAFCVQALPGLRSTCRWEGELQQSDESLLLVKTTAERYPALERTLAAHHPYDLPEILAVDAAAGLPAYLRWLQDETATGEPGDADVIRQARETDAPEIFDYLESLTPEDGFLFGDVSLADLVEHVLIHEIGHHFGLSDDDIDAIEDDRR